VSLTGKVKVFLDLFTGTSPRFAKAVQVGLDSLPSYVARPAQINIAEPGSVDRLDRSGVPNVSFSANSLRIPPGNPLEALKADRKGRHSTRINDPRRVCLVWKNDGAHRVEIVDYHWECGTWPSCLKIFIRARSWRRIS
jgi:hypothetical protein